jgi:hypothetical protein
VARRSGSGLLEVGQGEGQYGQRRHRNGVAPFDDGNFANPFCIMTKKRNSGLRVSELQISHFSLAL